MGAVLQRTHRSWCSGAGIGTTPELTEHPRNPHVSSKFAFDARAGERTLKRRQTWDRVLIVCAIDNIASAKTIERNGGILEGMRNTEHGPVRRYWLEIGAPDA